MSGRPVAKLVAIHRPQRRWLGTGELVARLSRTMADAGLSDDLARLAGETTDDLEPLS